MIAAITNIPVILENTSVLAALIHPNHLDHLSSGDSLACRLLVFPMILGKQYKLRQCFFMNMNQPLNEHEIDYLNTLLMTHSGLNKPMNVSELDGFLTALVSGPKVVSPTEWFSKIWQQPAGSLEEEGVLERVFVLVMRHMNGIAYIMQNALNDFEPLYEELYVEGHWKSDVTLWCQGYVQGMALGADEWRQLPKSYEAGMTHLLYFGSEAGKKKLLNYSSSEIEVFKAGITPFIRSVFNHWLSVSPEKKELPNYNFLPEKVGRNELCPCLSGKKYKKCCGVN